MKFIKLLVIGVALLATVVSVKAQSSVSYTLIPGAWTNLNSANPSIKAPLIVGRFTVQATTATNTAVTVIDAPTNTLTYIVSAYTNTTSYATNRVFNYTNYFGVVNQFTNLQLVTVTNSVAQSTNSYQTRFSASALASTTTDFDNLNYFFNRGVLVTNTSSGTAAITVSYEQ